MHSDEDFLTALATSPSDDVTRLVYADWLEERGDSVTKAEFLRLTVKLAEDPRKAGKKRLRKRLQQLAADLDTDWLRVVSRLPIESCRGKWKESHAEAEAEARRETRSRLRMLPYVAQFRLLCDQHWEDLRPTIDRAVRTCDACQQHVHYCDTITEARLHASAGHCIAVDLGVIRRKDDLQPKRIMLGMPSPDFMQAESERMEPDPVSAKRERRKRERGQNEQS
jgi:uncharacterized protein (TIGR02996 family)